MKKTASGARARVERLLTLPVLPDARQVCKQSDFRACVSKFLLAAEFSNFNWGMCVRLV